MYTLVADVNQSMFSNNRAINLGGAIYARTSIVVSDSNTFFCNVAGLSGGGLFVFGTRGVAPEESIFQNNLAPVSACGQYATSNGETCFEGDPGIRNACVCNWPTLSCSPETSCVPLKNTSTNSTEEFGKKSVQTDRTPFGFACICNSAAQWKSSYYCYNCSTCGQGTVTQPCTVSSDTVCQCPLGYTGHNCTQKCPTGRYCIELDESIPCTFDHTGSLPGGCKACAPGYLINELTGQCTACAVCGADGELVTSCEGSHDTVCRCPLGLTGNHCTVNCEMPPGCVSAYPGCAFSVKNPSLGRRCTVCSQGHFLDVEFQNNTQATELVGTCKPWTECLSDERSFSEPSNTTDRVCCGGSTGVPCSRNTGNLSNIHWTAVGIGIISLVIALITLTYMAAIHHAKKNVARKVDIELTKRRIRKNHQWVEANTEEAYNALKGMIAVDGLIDRWVNTYSTTVVYIYISNSLVSLEATSLAL